MEAITQVGRWLLPQTSLSRGDLLGSKGFSPLPHAQKPQENTQSSLGPAMKLSLAP